MTAYLVVSGGCSLQDLWFPAKGTEDFDIGIITKEPNNYNTGFELITQTLGDSSKSRGMNILGQQRLVKLQGTYIATSLANAQRFENNLNLIAKWQLQHGFPNTLHYYNTNSKVYAATTRPGMECMMKTYDIPTDNNLNPLVIKYTITLQECTNL